MQFPSTPLLPGDRIRGFSLIELMVTIAVLGITLSLALPSFSNVLARSRLKTAAEQMRADLIYARSEAQKRNRVIIFSADRETDGSWCYGMRINAACDCWETNTGDADYCFLDVDGSSVPIGKAVRSTAFAGITMAAAAFGGTLTFRPTRPTLVSDSATLSSAAESVRVVSSGARLRMCSPSGDAYLSHYPEC